MSVARHQPATVSPRSFACASISSTTRAGRVTATSSPPPEEASRNGLLMRPPERVANPLPEKGGPKPPSAPLPAPGSERVPSRPYSSFFAPNAPSASSVTKVPTTVS